MNKAVSLCTCIVSVSLLLTSCASGNVSEPKPNIAAQNTVVISATNYRAPTWDGKLPQASTMQYIPQPLAITPTAGGDTIDINLAIPHEFNITRPSEKLTTTYEKYFIMGTSNPNEPVFYGDEEIERQGTEGTFGVYVSLKMGLNTFKFSQGDETKSVTIIRKPYVGSESIPITGITQASMIPATFSGVKVGEALVVGCVAPSGSSVTATFNDVSVRLNQMATAKDGVPAFFKGEIIVNGDFTPDVTEKSGKVTYKMSYNGKTKSYTSTGDVYVAGENSNVAVRVKSYMGFVYPSLKDLSQFREKLIEGSADYMVSEDNTYAKLSSGGFVSKEQLEIVTGKVSVSNTFSKVKASSKTRMESYTFSGTNKPAFYTKLSDGKFAITFFNTKGAPSASVSGSKLFSAASVTEGKGFVTYTFTQKNTMLWGYDLDYSENNTVLTFKIKPSLKNGSRPLEGINVVLDPGHGGTDNGAIGFAALLGPTETDVNLAHAYATREVLEQMGANVSITRTKDVYFSLDDRLKSPESTNADVFVSIHHNSIGESVDANKVAGVEVYYHTAASKKLANSMMTAVTSKTGRTPRFVNQSYYRVTLSAYSPAILLELGYMSNPVEYERAANSGQIAKAAKAIADGIILSLS